MQLFINQNKKNKYYKGKIIIILIYNIILDNQNAIKINLDIWILMRKYNKCNQNQKIYLIQNLIKK